jgi:tetratricopeptide (TPR) repeat protein
MIPETIGRYHLRGVLGEGGMGTVYEAEQDQPHRLVALKVIRPDFLSAEVLRRFVRESEVLGRLQHPGIAQIYEAGAAEGPRGPLSFFAMELVRGQSLTEYADSRGLGLNQRLELFARICDAVHYAHRQGVIHRDLKPANIMVDASGQPKILDFGVARLTDADVQVTRQTSMGEVIGTLQYMSPEQVNADPDDIDARSDVYSLGVILYELVSGKLPYDLTKQLVYQAARVILLDDPVPLSSINRKLAGDVEIIVGKSLEKEKTRRYGSAEDLASDVRHFLQDEPIVARRASAIYQLRKFARRNRALVSGLALAAAILLIGTGVSLWLAVRATAAERLAESRRNEAVVSSALADSRRAVADSALLVADSARLDAQREQAAATVSAERAAAEAAKAQAINEFLQGMLASSDPANARGKELSVRELLDQASTGNGALSGEPEVRAAVAATIGRTYFSLGLYDQARPHFDSAYAIRRRVLGRADPSVGQSADELGKLASASGDYPLAERHLTEALKVMRAAHSPNDDRVTSILDALAHVRYRRGSFAEAESLYREALRRTRTRHPDAAVEVSARLSALGTFLSYTARAPEARPLLEEAVAILRRVHGTDHPAVVDGLVGLSDAKVFTPDYAGAEQTLRETLPIARNVYGSEHPTIANVLSRLGTVLSSQRKLEEAEPLIREALAMRVKLLGEPHPDIQLARVELARLVQAQGRYAEADTLLTLALAGRRAVLGDSSPAVAATLVDLGILYRLQENWKPAEERFRQAIPIWRAARIEDQELYALAELGWALLKQERLDESEQVLADVLTRRRALFGADHWSVGDSYEKLSAAAMGRGNVARAESLTVQGLDIRRKVYGPRSVQVATQLLNLALLSEARGDTAGAIPSLRESLAILESRPRTDLNVLIAERWLAQDLCATGQAAQGDSLIRAVIERVPLDSTLVLPYRIRGVLGFCLTRQNRFADAEPVLLEAEARLGALPPGAAHHKLLVTWLVNLYEQWAKPEQAARWRGR